MTRDVAQEGGRGRALLSALSTVLRLLCALAAVGLALLILLPPASHAGWLRRVAALEHAHLLAIVALLPLLPRWRHSRLRTLLALCAVVAGVAMLAPLLQALERAGGLREQLDEAFGQPPAAAEERLRPAPLSARELVAGVDVPEVATSTHTYQTHGDQQLQLDLYQPAQAAPAPLVVVVHGGGWQTGSRREQADMSRYLAGKGYAVAALDYRLAPEHPFPAARDDVLAALAYLKGRAAELGLDAGKIVLLGRSAGGQLALLVAYTAGDPTLRGVISLYGLADLRHSYEHPARPEVLDSREMLTSYLGGSPEAAAAAYRAAAPLSFVGPATPPTLLIHGARDSLVAPDESRLLAQALERAGRQQLLLELPWAEHGCDAILQGPCGQLTLYAVERFLASAMD